MRGARRVDWHRLPAQASAWDCSAVRDSSCRSCKVTASASCTPVARSIPLDLSRGRPFASTRAAWSHCSQPSATTSSSSGKIKTALFGGEGLFYAALTGPGRVWLQSLPFSRMADRIYKAAPAAGGSRRESGSILGGLGDLLDGDPN